MQPVIRAVKESDPFVSALHADGSPVAVYSALGFHKAVNYITPADICPCVSPGTLVCGIGVNCDFKRAMIAFRVPLPVPRGPFIAAEAMKSDRPFDVRQSSTKYL